MDYQTVKNKYVYKNYTHFDVKIYAKSKHDYISNKENIAKHAFYPFIHYLLQTKKFSKKINARKIKERSIYYSSHIDRYIYQYYSVVFNEGYNSYVTEESINQSAIAYRTNHDGKSNIHYAKDAFMFLRENPECYILVGDFESFFDKLGHQNLKNRLLKVLNTEFLDDDVYAVFKSLTRFSYIDLKKIKEHYKKKYGFSNRKFKKLDRYFEDDFNSIKGKYLKTHKINDLWKDEGIPQGTPLSGVLSNIYMINFDKEITNFSNDHGGLYRRYSDDFILIIRKDRIRGLKEIYDFVNDIIKTDGYLNIQNEKFGLYDYDNLIYEVNLIDFSRKNTPTFLDYLGFSFDGKHAILREKTVSKFYYKSYGYIDLQLEIETRQKQAKKISRRSKRKIFLKYTEDGSKVVKLFSRGNFITYVKRCKSIMNTEIDLFDDQSFLQKSRNKIIKRLSTKKKPIKKNSKKY